ncbi:MAG: hypothetical protein K2Q22_11200, partial [Cytophagales bacterium]|nr:hypothetical protein [Cytophagales bacterium]
AIKLFHVAKEIIIKINNYLQIIIFYKIKYLLNKIEYDYFMGIDFFEWSKNAGNPAVLLVLQGMSNREYYAWFMKKDQKSSPAVSAVAYLSKSLELLERCIEKGNTVGVAQTLTRFKTSSTLRWGSEPSFLPWAPSTKTNAPTSSSDTVSTVAYLSESLKLSERCI